MPRYIIIGAGAIGGGIGGRLAQVGHDVVLVARGADNAGVKRSSICRVLGRSSATASSVNTHPEAAASWL